MKTSNVLDPSFSFTHPETDAQTQIDFDDLVQRATRGDRRALGAIAIALTPRLLEEAGEVLGEDFEQEAGDVLQDFFLMLLEGRSRFVPAQGRALEWMCGVIRSIARRHRVACEMAWGIGDDP
jgi:DNA-directed RNA polymerase specialized sigma24 family protein